MGLVDTFSICFVGMLVVSTWYKRQEQSCLHCKRNKVVHIAFAGAVGRIALLSMLWMPYSLQRSRWDWMIASPTGYELIMHLYHYHDTGKNFKKFYFAHHLTSLFVVWPLCRLIENKPYPVSCLWFALLYEVASAWSHFLYVAHKTFLRWQILFYCSYLCFLCQRIMRWWSLTLGFKFAYENRQDFPYAIPLMFIPCVLFECMGCFVQSKNLPTKESLLLAHTIKKYD